MIPSSGVSRLFLCGRPGSGRGGSVHRRRYWAVRLWPASRNDELPSDPRLRATNPLRLGPAWFSFAGLNHPGVFGRVDHQSTWPPSWISTVAFGNSRLMSLALANGMMGSSVPATISVGCRINGSSGMLVQPASNRGAGDVPVLRCHTAGARGTRHVRLQRRHHRTRGTRPRMRGEEVDYQPGRRHRR